MSEARMMCPECFSGRTKWHPDHRYSCDACGHHWDTKPKPFEPKKTKPFNEGTPEAAANRAAFTNRRSLEVAESALALCSSPQPDWKAVDSIQRLVRRQGFYLAAYQKYPNRVRAANGMRRVASALSGAAALLECVEAMQPGLPGRVEVAVAAGDALAGAAVHLQAEVLEPLKGEPTETVLVEVGE